MGQKDYDSVVHNSRLASGILFPIPVTLDLTKEQLDKLNPDKHKKIALRDEEGTWSSVSVSHLSCCTRAPNANLCLRQLAGDPGRD